MMGRRFSCAVIVSCVALAACSGFSQLSPPHEAVPMSTGASQLNKHSIWSVVSSPNAPPIEGDLYDDLLYNVSADSPSDVWTVGWYCCVSYRTQEYDRSLIERWNGSAWSIVPSASNEPANSQLRGVATIAGDDAWAVGMSFNSGQPLIEHWDGATWSLTPSPNAPNGWLLSALAFSSNNVWAVGTDSSQPLAEQWDGNQWNIISTPGVSGGGSTNFWSLSASGPNDIWAVGETDHPDPNVFAEHWNGSAWTLSKPVNNFYFSLLYAVASVSPTDVWAVGYEARSKKQQQLRTLIEHWDGTKWSVITSPNEGPKSPYPLNNVLSAVTAISADDVWAGGYWTSADSNFRALFEHWNGKKWTIEPGPRSLEQNGNGSFSQIMGFANLGGGTIWATGYQSQPGLCCDETLTLQTTHG